jgi:translocation and assembly module TamB
VVEADPLLDTVRMNIEVRGVDALRVRNNLADLHGEIDLSVQGTIARPRVFGKIELERGGEITYAGEQYEITRGLLTFADPYEINPLIDLVAATRRRDYDVLLNLSGTRDRLAVNLTSDPPLPEMEVLSLLASGKVSSDTGLTPTSSRQTTANAADLLYRQAANLVGDRVSNLFGLDRFRLDPLGSGDSVSSARVTVGKRLSKDVFVTYSLDPSSTENSVLEVEWQVSDRVVLVLSQNADGSYSVDARFEQSF